MAQELVNTMRALLVSVTATVVAWYMIQHAPTRAVDPPPPPNPIIIPAPGPTKPNRRPLLPRPLQEELVGKIVTGGPVGPDGKSEVACDLPLDQRIKNVGGRDGAGLCVFTSINHAARWQNELRLLDFQKKMRAELGGGYPQKVDTMIKKYGPGTRYIQYEGRDPTILKLALRTGRMPGVTYNGHDPHYGGSIAHMVNLVYYDEQADLACILDNNFIGENELVWLSCKEFIQRWTGGSQGWAVVLLTPPPPPPPKN